MNKIDDILDRLQGQLPAVPNPDELTEQIMNNLPERSAKSARRKRLYVASAIAIAASIALLLMLHLGNISKEDTPVMAHQTMKQTSTLGDVHDNTMRLRGTSTKGKDNLELSPDSDLLERIAKLEIVPTSADLGSGNIMRLGGTCPIKNDSILTIIDGKPTLLATNQLKTEEEIGRHLHVAIDNIMVYKDEKNKLPYIKKFGEMAKNGVVVIKTKPDIKDSPSLQDHIAGLDIPQIRLAGRQIRKDSFIIVVNGQIQPDLNNRWFQRNLQKYFYNLQQIIDKIKVLSVQATKAIYGVENHQALEIITLPDTLCDAYVRQHPELMQTRRYIEGYVLGEDEKPLDDTWIACDESNMGAATDSTGHFVMWAPPTVTKLYVRHVGYQTIRHTIQPTDTILNFRMKDATIIKEVIVLKKGDERLVPLGDNKFNPDELKKHENVVIR